MIRSERGPGTFSRRDGLAIFGLGAAAYAVLPTKEQRPQYDIPQEYLRLYQQYGGEDLWPILAAIGKQESNHGRSRRAGVRSGHNYAGCCVGPMQFNVMNGPISTWDEMGKAYQGHDRPIPGRTPNPYDPKDAIPSARDLLLSYGVEEDARSAIDRYSGSVKGYVDEVLQTAKIYKALYPIEKKNLKNIK